MIKIKYKILRHKPYDKIADACAVLNHYKNPDMIRKSLIEMELVPSNHEYHVNVVLIRDYTMGDIVKEKIETTQGKCLTFDKTIPKDDWDAFKLVNRKIQDGVTHIICTNLSLSRCLSVMDLDEAPIKFMCFTNPNDNTLSIIERCNGSFWFNYTPNIPSSEKTRDRILDRCRSEPCAPTPVMYDLHKHETYFGVRNI